MSTIKPQRATRRIGPVLAALLLAASAALSGCAAPSSGTQGAGSGSASVSATAGPVRTYGFDEKGTLAGVPPNSKLTPVTLAWFPPAGTDGLRPLLDQQQLVQITQAAMASSQFWILPTAESTGPLTFGDAAREAVTRHGEFTSGQIVAVVPVIGKPAGGRVPPLEKILGKPTGYQVYLEGPAGVTSFGMSPGAKPGTWNLDSRGELLNWKKAIGEVGRDVGFVPTRAVVTHTAFGVDGKRAVILSWLVFTDARGRTLAATLRDLPPTGVTWKLGAEPLQSGALHPFATIFTTVTATPSR